MASEITSEAEEEGYFINKEAEKTRIRQIIAYQKSLYLSSSSSSSTSSFSSSTASSRKSSSLMDLMKEGSTSLRRLFDMEHTSLGNYFQDYSVSPIIKPILLWGSDSDNDHTHDDPWAEIRKIGGHFSPEISHHHANGIISSKQSFQSDDGEVPARVKSSKTRKLIRTKSYKTLPRFGLWKCGQFKFRLKLIRRLRIVVRGRKI